jgi:hypothetical protein
MAADLVADMHLPFLQRAEPLRLHVQARFADFVEENRAAIGRLRESLARLCRVRSP